MDRAVDVVARSHRDFRGELLVLEIARHHKIVEVGLTLLERRVAIQFEAERLTQIFLDGQWHRFHWGKKLVAGQETIGKLDVSLLQQLVLARVLGIEDPRRDPRIKFVGGIRGTGELEKLVKSGQFAVAFSMFPTSLLDLMAVADEGQVMPPKSTWFEPKLRDGLFSHLL